MLHWTAFLCAGWGHVTCTAPHLSKTCEDHGINSNNHMHCSGSYILQLYRVKHAANNYLCGDWIRHAVGHIKRTDLQNWLNWPDGGSILSTQPSHFTLSSYGQTRWMWTAHVLHEGPYRDCLEVSCKVPFWQKQVAQCFVRLPTGRSELHSALRGSQPAEVSLHSALCGSLLPEESP